MHITFFSPSSSPSLLFILCLINRLKRKKQKIKVITKQQKIKRGMVNSTSTFHIPQFEGCFSYTLLNPRDSMTWWSNSFLLLLGPPPHHFMHILLRPTSLTSITFQTISLKCHFFLMPPNNASLHLHRSPSLTTTLIFVFTSTSSKQPKLTQSQTLRVL